MNLGTATCPAGLLQRITCYLTRVVEATPGGRDNRMRRVRPDLVNQSADRPPALLDLGRYLAGGCRAARPRIVMLRGGTPWAPPPPASPGSTCRRTPSTPACSSRAARPRGTPSATTRGATPPSWPGPT